MNKHPVPILNSRHESERSSPSSAARKAYELIAVWEAFVKPVDSGIIATLFTLTKGLLHAIRDGSPEDIIRAKIDVLVVEWGRWHEVLKASPFSNPSYEQLSELGRRVQATDGALAQARATIKQLESEVATLNQHAPTRELGTLSASFEGLVQTMVNHTASAEQRIMDVNTAVKDTTQLCVDLLTTLSETKQLGELWDQKLSAFLKQPAVSAQLEPGKIQAGIEMWQGWLRRVSQFIQENDDRLDTLEAVLDEAIQNARFGSQETVQPTGPLTLMIEQCKLYGNELLELEQHGRTMEAELRHYTQAVDRVRQGLTPSVWQSPDIPVPPSEKPTKEETVVDTPAAAPVPTTATPLERLQHVANQHGLNDRGVFLVTLYQLLPPKHTKRAPRKGLLAIILLAREAELLSTYGYNSPHELMKEWRKSEQDPVHAFLQFTGQPAKESSHVYGRNTVPLPWNPTELLSAEDIQRFQVAVLKSYSSPG